MSAVPPSLRIRPIPEWVRKADSDALSLNATRANVRAMATAVAILWDIVASHAKHEHCPDCDHGLDTVVKIGGE